MEKVNDGQHRSNSYYTPGSSSGMKSVISESARVGHASGGETHGSVPAVHRSVNVNTTTGSAGPKAVGETHSADDK